LSDSIPLRSSKNFALIVTAVLVTWICLFSHLGAIGLVGPDEPRYAAVARTMAATGDWVTPHLYGQPWFEKPILYYWAGALGFRLHLSAEWAARLPSAFGALAAALSIGWLGWKHDGGKTSLDSNPALLAPLLFSTSVAAIGFARAASPDMLFSASTTLAMASAASVLHRTGGLRSACDLPPQAPRGDTFPLLLFGAFLGTAVLAKGPAGLILGGGAVALWALVTKQWRAALRLAHPAAIVAFCTLALPWYVLCALRNPEFIRVFIFRHNVERYLTPVFQHRQPFWYFGPILVLGLLPWTALLLPALQGGLRIWHEKSWNHSPGFFFASWAVFPLLFFSFSQSKLPGYILPVIPPLALILAISMTKVKIQSLASSRWILVAIGFTWMALGLSTAHWMNRLPATARDSVGQSIFVCALIAIVGGLGITALGIVRRKHALLLSLILAALLVEIAGAWVLPTLDPYLSARQHAGLLRNDRYPGRVFTFHLRRSWTYGLAFYLDRQVPEWLPVDLEPALVLTTPDGFDEIRRLGRFQGTLDEAYHGVFYVPVLPAPR
jgi:4-amino-4-deoxy-L-arabinose transferase-like glycosyltransferase